MRVALAALLLLPTTVAAQELPRGQADRVTQRIGAQIGALIIENAGLSARVEELQMKVDDLRKRLQEAEKKVPEKPE